MALASLWPGFFANLDYYMDDRSAYEDDNELTALGLIFDRSYYFWYEKIGFHLAFLLHRSL
jgi:hypothetical protein